MGLFVELFYLLLKMKKYFLIVHILTFLKGISQSNIIEERIKIQSIILQFMAIIP